MLPSKSRVQSPRWMPRQVWQVVAGWKNYDEWMGGVGRPGCMEGEALKWVMIGYETYPSMQRHVTEDGNQWLHVCGNLKTWRHSSASISKTFWYVCVAEFLKIKKGSPCKDGDYSASQDCAKYLVCLWGTYQEFTCGPGLHWNSVSCNMKMSAAVLRVFKTKYSD